MDRLVRMGVTVLAVSLLGAGVGTYFMARRAQAFNATLPDQFLFKAQSGREISAFGRPITLQDTTTTVHGQEQAAVRVTYGDAAVTIPVIAPKVKDFKDLSTYEESFRVLSFAPIKDGKADIKPFADDNWRAIIVARETRPGFDQDTWGEVRVKDWTWVIYELLPQGGIDGPRTVQYRDRRGRTPAEVYARDELKKAGKEAPPLPEQGGPRLTAVEPIQERSWEWQAALFTVPKMQVSRYRFRSDAVGGTSEAEGMGWTLPLTGFSLMGMVAGCGLVMAGRAGVQRAAARD
ncbi:MAG TPA: hypothetical protein VFF65_12775, partial [Phycisphaerales bacterium]|nr:hypothetical protein [Phycisphaerales bacterium]